MSAVDLDPLSVVVVWLIERNDFAVVVVVDDNYQTITATATSPDGQGTAASGREIYPTVCAGRAGRSGVRR